MVAIALVERYLEMFDRWERLFRTARVSTARDIDTRRINTYRLL